MNHVVGVSYWVDRSGSRAYFYRSSDPHRMRCHNLKPHHVRMLVGVVNRMSVQRKLAIYVDVDGWAAYRMGGGR